VAEMVSRYYLVAELQELRAGMKQRVEKAISVQRSKIQDFQKRLEESDGADEWRQKGEVLSMSMHAIKQGATEVTVPDWSNLDEETQEPAQLKVSLDPSKSAQENVELMFLRFKKLNRQREAVTPLIKQCEASLVELVEVLETLQTMPKASPDQAAAATRVLRSLECGLESRGIVKRRKASDTLSASLEKADAMLQAKSERKGRQVQPRGRGKAPEFMRFRSPSGLEVVAGRSSKQNDRVTWGIAKDRDVWFHARGIGGSHVVLIIPKCDDEEAFLRDHRDDVLFAAGVAAFYSKGRKDTKVDVSYTPRRHLRPPPPPPPESGGRVWS